MNKCDCNKPKCEASKCQKDGFVFRKVVIPAQLGDDVTGKEKPENGAMTNSFVTYAANGAQYIYDSFGVYTKFAGETEVPVLSVNGKIGRVVLTTSDLENDSDYITVSEVAESIGIEASEREAADQGLQTQIDALAAASDVTDIVGTHAELEAYDTSKLKNNDIIKVLQDETQDDETTYYRWSTSTEEFTLIGAEGPYYTKSAADAKFQDKLTAGDHITIDSSDVISADGQTIFYANSQETGATRHIYKDAAFTQAASAQDLLDANEEGPVVLRITTNPNPDGLFSDAYIQNTYVGDNDYQFLFLDERTYREYAASAPSDTTFYYFSNTIQSQLTAGTNIQINNNTISATDTTYSNFTGTDGVDPGTAGLVPAPATTDAGKYLKADGTWDTVAAGPTVVQTTGTSQTGVMSQDATTKMLYPTWGNGTNIAISPNMQLSSSSMNDNIIIKGSFGGNAVYGYGMTLIGASSQSNYSPNCTAIGHNAVVDGTLSSPSYSAIALGYHSYASKNGTMALGAYSEASGTRSIALGSWDNFDSTSNTKATGNWSTAIGAGAKATSTNSIALGFNATAGQNYSVAIGGSSTVSRQYEVSVGAGSGTYATRYIANVKDPSLAQDAATKNYVDTAVASAGATLLTYTQFNTLWSNA